MSKIKFTIEKKLPGKLGRAAILETPHGVIKTPSFVTVGTKGTVKGLTTEQIVETGAQVVLSNTYHLYLDPGQEIIKHAGGLNKMMDWHGPTMTDSGGFQVFSLGAAYGKNITKFAKGEEEIAIAAPRKIKREDGEVAKIAKIDADGVMFRSNIDGSAHYFTPEKSIEIQHDIGADIIFAFDECTSPSEPYNYQAEALDRTHRWAKRSLDFHQKKGSPCAIFGIIQGGRHENLRKESAAAIAAMDFDGFGIGGSFAKEDMSSAVEWVNTVLPEEKPRHLLGIGEPEDLFGAVENGCDLFDCVAPTRLGRTGTLYTNRGKINILNAKYRNDFGPLDDGCGCYVCKNFTKAYLAHLFRAEEMLGCILGSIHNLYFINHLVMDMRQAIVEDRFSQFKEEFLKGYGN